MFFYSVNEFAGIEVGHVDDIAMGQSEFLHGGMVSGGPSIVNADVRGMGEEKAGAAIAHGVELSDQILGGAKVVEGDIMDCGRGEGVANSYRSKKFPIEIDLHFG